MKQNLAALIWGLSIIFTALIFAAAYKYKFKGEETITVTGLAEKSFTSNLIVWKGDYSRKMPDLKSAYSLLKKDEATVLNYLKSKGIKDQELQFSSVEITKDFIRDNDARGNLVSSKFDGYTLDQNVTIQSKNVDKVEKVSREITELIEEGIEMNSQPPSYYYTNLSELKIGLLARASADAKLRAETIAKNSGSDLGNILKANMGVFQITGDHDNETFAGGGAFNTSSRNKTASITIRIDYSVH
jgi:hypothetical protein